MESNQQPYTGNGSITKQEICRMYQFSSTTFRRLFNVRYFVILQEAGYLKDSRLVSNRVFRKFTEIYGEPL